MAQSPAAMLAELERIRSKLPEGRPVVIVLRPDAVPGDPEASADYLRRMEEWIEMASESPEVSTLLVINLAGPGKV